MENFEKRIKKLTKNNDIKLNGIFNVYQTLDIYHVDAINPSKPLKLYGYKMKTKSHRYQLFERDEKTCVCCGTKAKFWALQRGKNSKGNPHLNLYGINKENKLVLFSKDHILPRSMGGEDILENYQIMCQECNSKKDNNVDWEALKIDTQEYIVTVQLIDFKKTIIQEESVKVKANNEDNAKGIACKLTRERVRKCHKSLPLSVALI